MSTDSKWTVVTGITVVLAVFLIVIAFRPGAPASPSASPVITPGTTTPQVSPAATASTMTADPTLSATPLIISTAAPMTK